MSAVVRAAHTDATECTLIDIERCAGRSCGRCSQAMPGQVLVRSRPARTDLDLMT